MRLESGPANYDRNYNIVIMLLGLVMGAYFLYDHAIGYPKKNRVAAEQKLTPLAGSPQSIWSDGNDQEVLSLTSRIGNNPEAAKSPEAQQLQARLREIVAGRIAPALPKVPTEDDYKNLVKTEPSDPEIIRKAWGPPRFTITDGGSTAEFYPNAYGLVIVPIVGKYVDFKRMLWTPWDKSQDDIQIQLYCAVVAFVFGLFFLRRAYKAATLRVVIDDEGLVYAGLRVPFENMTKFANYSKKGWVDLFYMHGEQLKKIRFDNQKVGKYDEIIDALCRAKKFPDPRKVEEDDDRDDEADDKK
jgi:hypothetical protein